MTRPFDCSAFEDEYPFRSRWLTRGEHRIHYVDEGSGPVLLFVHGNPTWSFAWRNLIKAFSSDFRCIAVDHMGCGLSDKPGDYSYRLDTHIGNLTALIEHLGLSDITLLAHDWGGAIGMGAAGRESERFRRFVLFNTAAFRSRRMPWRIRACRIPLLGRLAVRGLNAFAGAAVRMAVARPLSPAVKAGYLAPYHSWATRIATYEFVRDIPMDPDHPSYNALVRVEEGLAAFVSHPMLLMWGALDWCFTTDFLEEFRRRFPNAESEVFADASHYVFEDAGDRITARLRTFLSVR